MVKSKVKAKSQSHYDQWSVNQYVLVSSPRSSRGAPSERISIDFRRGILRWNLLCYHWEGCMWSMQCNVKFEYQLSICSGTTEYLARFGWSQDLPDTNWLLASSPALNMRALTLVPVCAFFFFSFSFIFLWNHLQVVFTKILSVYKLDKNQTMYNTCGRNKCI
jgi:hypothetical protein